MGGRWGRWGGGVTHSSKCVIYKKKNTVPFFTLMDQFRFFDTLFVFMVSEDIAETTLLIINVL